MAFSQEKVGNITDTDTVLEFGKITDPDAVLEYTIRGPKRRIYVIDHSEQEKTSYYGAEPELLNEYYVYPMNFIYDATGEPDITKIKWAVRNVGYQMGQGFDTLDSLREFLKCCTLETLL